MKKLSTKARLVIYVYLAFLKLSWILHEKLNTKIRGIGVASDFVKSDFDFMFRNCEFRFSPIAARSYGLLPVGIPNEPETHRFLDAVLAYSIDPIVFVDIGASIGEFAITMANQDKVAKVYAFEPHPRTFTALAASTEKLKTKILLFQNAVAEADGTLPFSTNDQSPTGAGLGGLNGGSTTGVSVCRIDVTLGAIENNPSVILIDIEGGELNAILGGLNFINARQPLIIFEYNIVSRRFFTLEQMQECLRGYTFFRLQSVTGKLDLNLKDTWNVVAIPGQGFWSSLRDKRELFDTSCQMPYQLPRIDV